VIFTLFILVGCGVKSDPIPPNNAVLPSYPDEFVKPEEETKKKKKN
tara:strand:+ start:284548 stop:284685 length:138 start_codon:yes stop_codon:yes gene_type:complete